MDIQAFMDKRYQWDGEGMSNTPDNAQEFAELVRMMHYAIATSETMEISHCQSEVYKASVTTFKAAIQLAYPNLPTSEIYEVWVDCNETVAYCATVVKNRIADEKAEDDEFGCEGHETLRGDLMGESFYCDGTCNK